MRTLLRIVVLIGWCLTVASMAQDKQPTINDFAWMAGCWENTTNKSSRDEIWSKAAGGSMIGRGRVVANGKTSEYEFMRIHQEADGMYFTALPSGQNQTSFKLIKMEGKKAIFENLKNDFPHRVIYGQNPDGSLFARIEGEIKGKKRGIDFAFQRTTCEMKQEAANVY